MTEQPSDPQLMAKYNSRKNLLLVLSIVFDIVGILSYLIPAFGEVGDIIWAPIAGFALYVMYGGYLGVFGGVFVFLEEIIPFTDFIPGFLIMWFVKYVVFAKKTQQQFFEAKGQHLLPEKQPAEPVKQLPANG